MTRLALFALVLLAACDKPTTESCRKALANMQHLLGTENLNQTGFEGEVRRCRGGSSRKSVECASNAATLDELRKCEFYKVPDSPPAGSGSAAGSAK